MPYSMRRIVTYVNEAEYKALQTYCKKHDLSLYKMAKTAIKEFVARHP